MRALTVLLLAGAAALAGCSGDEQPADVPIPADSLTTTTTSPPYDAEETTRPTGPPADDESPTTAAATAGGIPEMPPEAMEDTEAGAEAFALHYIDLINATGMEPTAGVLEPLAADGCASCENYEDNVETLASDDLKNDGHAAEVIAVSSADLGSSSRVEITVNQLPIDIVDVDGAVVDSYEAVDEVVLSFRLAFNDGWLVQEIVVAE